MSLKKYLTKKNIIIIICFLVIIGIGSYFLINYLRVKNAVIKVTLDETLETEFLSDVKVSDFISDINGTIVDDYVIDTTDIGKKKIEFEYINDDNIKVKYNYEINVVDNVASLIWLNNSYTVNKSNNSFENSIKNEIDRLENTYGQDSLTNLTTNLTAIFISDRSQQSEKEKAVRDFNVASKKLDISSFDEIDEDSTIREDVYKYYEYIQFKRAYFNCTNVKYNSKTGRIISMEFEATGKLN